MQSHHDVACGAFQRFIVFAVIRPAGPYGAGNSDISSFFAHLCESVAHCAGLITDGYSHCMAFFI